MIDVLFEDRELTNIIKDNQSNNWKGAHFEGYESLSTKNKGVLGEAFVEKYMHLVLGCKVQPPTDSGHDRIISDFTTEIKFGLAHSPKIRRKGLYEGRKMIVPDEFTFNHIAIEKNWERFIFCGINPESSNQNMLWERKSPLPDQLRMFFMTKSDFAHYMNNRNRTENIFAHQQGGGKSDNDDYMVAGYRKFQKLISLPFVRPIEEWSK